MPFPCVFSLLPLTPSLRALGPSQRTPPLTPALATTSTHCSCTLYKRRPSRSRWRGPRSGGERSSPPRCPRPPALPPPPLLLRRPTGRSPARAIVHHAAVLSHPPPFENKRRREIKSSSPPSAGQRVLSSSRAKGVVVQARVAAGILVTSPVIHRRKDLVARVSGGKGAWPWQGSSVVAGSLAAAAKDLDGGARESGALDPLEGRLDPTRGTAARQGGSPLVRRHP